MNPEVMIVAGEASGDLHGSHLVKEIQELNPSLKFCGIGGPELKKVGVELLYDASKIAVVGLFEVVSHLSDIITAQKRLRERLVKNRPSLLILIDFPDFNFLLAKKAKKLGIPVFYYISPQVWAWRSGRVHTIGRLVEKIGVILPFEEQFYRDRGVDAHYVGHPLLDSVQADLTRSAFCKKYSIDPDKTLIGIIPGSRLKEIRKLLPDFISAAKLFQAQCKEKPVFLVPRASTIDEQDLIAAGIGGSQAQLDIRIISDDRYNVMAACDAAVAASGTVTLELLLLDTPMVVTYRLAPMTYHIGKFFVKGTYFSLVNLIGDQNIVPELLQKNVTGERISEELFRLVFNETARAEMAAGFEQVRKKLGQPGASRQAAELALSVIK